MKLFGCLSNQSGDESDARHHLDGIQIIKEITTSMLAKKSKEELVELALEQRQLLEEQRVKNERLRVLSADVADSYTDADAEFAEPSERIKAAQAKLIDDIAKLLETAADVEPGTPAHTSLIEKIERIRALNTRTIESIEHAEATRLEATARREQKLKAFASFARDELKELMLKRNEWYKKVD